MGPENNNRIVFWAVFSAVAFAVSVGLIVAMVLAGHHGVLVGTDGEFVRYAISLVLGASAAALTVGALRTTAIVNGNQFGVNFEIGGAGAVLVMTVCGAFYFTSVDTFNQGIYLKESKTKKPLSAQSMTLVLELDNGPRLAEVGPGGFAEFKDLPSALKNTYQGFSSQSPAYEIPERYKKIRLTGEVLHAEADRNDKVMWSFRRKVNYQMIRLLVPLRLMAGDTLYENGELPVSPYLEEDVLDAIVSMPLNTDPGTISLEELQDIFVYLPTEPIWKTELLNGRGTYAERLADGALNFVEFYQNLSQLEMGFLSDEELTLIHSLRSATYIERVKNLVGISLDEDETLIKAEVQDFLQKMVAVEDEMGPFEQPFVVF